MKRNRQEVFRDVPVWRAIMILAVPAVVNILVMFLYNMADMFFVARLHDDAMVGSISITSPVFTLMMAFGSMIGGGGSNLIARMLGEGDQKRVRLMSSLCAWGSFFIGLLFAAVVFLFRGSILSFLGANDEMRSYAAEYLSVLAIGAPAMIFSSAFTSVVRGEGAIKEAMFAHLLSTAVNLVLDPLFILVFHWGVAGAAAATVLGNLAGSVFLIHYVLTKSSSFSLSPRLAFSAPLEIRHVLALGLPNGTSSFLTSFAAAMANNLMVRYGTAAVAASAAANKSTTIITMVQMGICMGVQPLLAYNYGAKNLPRIRETLRKLAIVTLSVGAAAAGFCYLNSASIISLFLKDPSALELGQRIIRLRLLMGPIMGIFYIGSNFLQASGNAPMAMLVSLLRQGIFLIPLLYLMDWLFQVMGNVSAHLVADLLATGVAVFLALRQYRKLRATLPDGSV